MVDYSLAQFETFIKVAKLGSFTQAAKELGISKAAVSQAIKQMEQSLQCPLFIRTTRHISVTDEGRALLAQCERLWQELECARHLVGSFHKEPTGTLRISTNPYIGDQRLLKHIKQYRKQFPKVDIEVIIEERMPNMHDENIDLVFGANWPAPEDVIRRKIGTTRYVLCASPEYLEQYGTPKTMSDLKNHHYIPHTGRNMDLPIVQLKHAFSGSLKMPLRTNHAHFMKMAALDGLGIIQLHDYMVEEALQMGTLVEVLSDQLLDEIGIYIYYYRHRFVQPKIRQFVNMVLEANL